MIERPWEDVWLEPNARCSGTDIGGQHWQWLTVATDFAVLESELQDKGWTDLQIESVDFQEHMANAVEYQNRLEAQVASGEKLKFHSNWWSALKSHLFGLFGGKCAYCEALPLDVSPGDVEHFRPKARVDDEPGHTGYYWLAYDPSNLLPVCENCNRYRGKKNAFPVVAGTRAFTKDQLSDESFLLVNPYFDHPDEHFEFLDTGIVGHLTERGRVSIEVYGLNRLPLVEARRRSIARLKQEFPLQIATLVALNQIERLNDYMSDLCSPYREYSAFDMAAAKRKAAEMQNAHVGVVAMLETKKT